MTSKAKMPALKTQVNCLQKDTKVYGILFYQVRNGQGQLHNKNKHGEFYWEFATVSPIKNPAGKITHFIFVKDDITQLKNTEQALQEAKEKTEQATHAKSVFLANISHELRTPLNTIINYSQTLEEIVQDKGLQKIITPDLGKIKSAGDHLLSMITNLLDPSTVEPQKKEVDHESFDVPLLIDEVRSIIEPKAKQYGNVVNIEIGDDVSTMASDRTKLIQILINLLDNACKYTKNGTVTLKGFCETKDTGDQVIFKVSDTGIGMTDEQLRSIFSQEGSSTTMQSGTSGLGLAISCLFARMLGGNLTAQSECKVGSTVTLSLPNNN